MADTDTGSMKRGIVIILKKDSEEKVISGVNGSPVSGSYVINACRKKDAKVCHDIIFFLEWIKAFNMIMNAKNKLA